MSLYIKHRTYSKKAEEDKILGDKLFYEMFYKKGMKILDIGCSIGTFELNDPKNIIGLDRDKEAIKIAKNKGLDCRYCDVNINKFPFKDNTFDAVNCKSILAHIRNTLFFLKEARRVLKTKGKIVIYTSNIKVLKFKFYEDYTHVSPFTKESLGHILYDVGFRNYNVYNLPISMIAMGFLYKNKILLAKKIYLIEKFFTNSILTSRLFFLFDNRINLLAEAYK